MTEPTLTEQQLAARARIIELDAINRDELTTEQADEREKIAAELLAAGVTLDGHDEDEEDDEDDEPPADAVCGATRTVLGVPVSCRLAPHRNGDHSAKVQGRRKPITWAPRSGDRAVS